MGLFSKGKKEVNSIAINVNANQEREFDLNIEKILESWEVYHAVREIIANALDEQIITKTKEIDIFKKDGAWHIVDYGRGLNYHHLTQNENEEKLTNDKLIGRFGVGLKDALATLYRHNIKVKIVSKFGIITLSQAPKMGFDDIVTLHAKILPSTNPEMAGTDFIMEGCADRDIEIAKSLFLAFSNQTILETTEYGQVIRKNEADANIYINGVKVAAEPNFLFSYNITSLTKQLKKALNRERTNVGRSAYTDRIKSILTACKSDDVINELVHDSQQFGTGTKHDELSWSEIAMFAYKKLSEKNTRTTFITADELESSPSIIDDMKRDGYNPVVVPTNLSQKMDDYNSGSKDGGIFNTTSNFIAKQEESFKPTIIEESELTAAEREVFGKMDAVLALIGGKPRVVRTIAIAEKIYEHEYLTVTTGLWESLEGRILIKRSQLSSISAFAGTLLHECAHARSGSDDVSRNFELELTNMLGILAQECLK